MTDKLRRAAAKHFRELLDQGLLRKEAILRIFNIYGVSRRSLYEYCKKFKVPTN